MKNGWQTKKLGELCEIELGRTPARANGKFWDEKRETGNVWLSIADLLKAEDNIVVDSKEYVSDKGAEICKLVPKGTLLVSFKLTLGRLAFAGRDLFTNEAIAALTIFNERELSKEFLFYFLHFFDWVKAAENDVKLKGMTLNKAKLKEMDIHFPKSLAEQKRIVSLLDEAFKGLTTAKANAEENLQNARALFESHLQFVFTQRGKGWEKHPLVSVCALFVDSAHRTPKYQDEGIPALRPRDVVNGKLNLEGALRVSEEEYEIQSKRHKPSSEDIVYSRELSYGWATLLPKSPRVCLSQGMCLFRPSSKLDAAFLLYVLNGSLGREQATRAAVGAAHPHINLGDIKSYSIPVPPLDEQRKITRRLDKLSEATQRLASLYERKLAALEALKKSLLHQALTGEL
jgi:type I restriction enzyme S subunit